MPFVPIPASPALHLVHVALPSSDFSPTPQETHSKDPSSFDFVLASHFVQLVLKVAPRFGFFFPAAHLLQSSGLVTPVADEYRPRGHPTQTLLETAPISAEYDPAGQSSITVKVYDTCMYKNERKRQCQSPKLFQLLHFPVSVKKFDIPLQLAFVTSSWYIPGEQGVHDSFSVSSLLKPMGHSLQEG